jgi:hypothetical protein
MSLGRDEGERIQESRLIVVGPNSLRRPRNGVHRDAHARMNALIIALTIQDNNKTRAMGELIIDQLVGFLVVEAVHPS